MKHILFCKKCKKFTMNELCACGEKAESLKPAKYSPHFKYAHLRREARKKELEEKGLF